MLGKHKRADRGGDGGGGVGCGGNEGGGGIGGGEGGRSWAMFSSPRDLLAQQAKTSC